MTSGGGSARCVHAFGGLDAVIVQPAVTGGVEVSISVLQEQVFGPLVLFGIGGAAADVLADRAARLAPLTDSDADELIRSIRAPPLLLGRPGTPAADLVALRDMLLRVSQMADELPQMAELDPSPVVPARTASGPSTPGSASSLLSPPRLPSPTVTTGSARRGQRRTATPGTAWTSLRRGDRPAVRPRCRLTGEADADVGGDGAVLADEYRVEVELCDLGDVFDHVADPVQQFGEGGHVQRRGLAVAGEQPVGAQ